MPNKVKKRHLLDYSIFIPYLILSIVGLIMVYSSTSALQVMKGFSPTSFVINQVAFWVVGLVAMFFIYKMKTSVFQNRSFIMFAIAVITVMVLAVRIPGIGKEINGARGWIEIGGFSMQPAEYLKIMVVWYLSYILARRQKTIDPFAPPVPESTSVAEETSAYETSSAAVDSANHWETASNEQQVIAEETKITEVSDSEPSLRSSEAADEVFQEEMKLHPEFDANSAASQRELKQALNKLEEERPTERFPELEYFGQMHGTYLFAQSKDGLFIIDQHAAQERIKYEYFREKIGEVSDDLQELLVPIVIDYPNSDALKIKEQKETLAEVGIHLEDFGQNSFIVRAHPTWYPAGEEESIVREMIDMLLTTGSVSVKKFREATAIMMSCKRSIVEILLDKLVRASKDTGIRDIAIAGGVSANSGLRNGIVEQGLKRGWRTFLPEFKFTTDNAAMIAMAGYYHYQHGDFSSLDVSPVARLEEL